MLLPIAALPLVGVGVAKAGSGDPPGTIYVADAAGEIAVFAPGANGDVAPERVISGADTALAEPWGVAVNAAGNVFVSNVSGNSITEYAPQASGDATPICIISGNNTGLDEPQHLSLLPDGSLVVANLTDSAADGGAITVYPPGACGDVTPVETIAGGSTTFSSPGGVGVDGTGTIFEADAGNQAINEFPAGAGGNVAPQATISGTGTGLGTVEDLNVGFDGKVYAVSGLSITVYPAGSTGDATPSQDITGASTGLGGPTGVAVSSSGGIVVTDGNTTVGGSDVGGAVLSFAAGDNGNVAPATAIYGSSSTLTTPEGLFVTGPQQSSSATLTTDMTTAANIPVSDTTSDSATLSGGTTAPTGSVIFRLYGPNDPTCSAAPAFTSSSRQVSGDGTVSASYSPATAGTYSWVAAYSGDASNAPVTTACGQSSQTVEVGVTPTTVATGLIYNGQNSTSISVAAGQEVFDVATLSGEQIGSEGGTIAYNVYSDSACTQLVNGGAPIAVSAGDVPESQPVTLDTPGTYYWQAVYSGDAHNGGAASTCGPNGEVETVTPGGNSTTLTTTLTGGTQSGTTINVDSNTSVTDTGTLGGEFAGEATGTVTYTVYSDSACTKVAVAGMAETITEQGVLPPSPRVKLAVGTYYWQASYSGDNNNAASASSCGANGEVENVAPGTTVTTSLSSGSQAGASITVSQNATVTDAATLTGSTASSATGTVTYNVYSDSACTELYNGGSPLTIATAGTLPASDPMQFGTPGTYYWQAVYSGDSKHGGSSSNCGDEVLTVNEVPMPTTLTTSLDGDGQTGTAITVPEGTTVADQAALAGANASEAAGTVTYDLYSDSACKNLVSGGSDSVTVTGSGDIPFSAGVTLSTPGTYYLTATYSGDNVGNDPSATTCGSETVTVTGVVQPKALILADSVTVPGQSPAPFAESLEQYEAEQDGYTVTSVTGAQWDAMTAAQFAQYRVVIIGDNTCSGESEFDAAVQNQTTWEPVVMNSGGNKVLIGTDPVFHYFPGGPQAQLLAHGIAYAGDVAGATGAYVDLSCAYDSSPESTPVPLLDGLSTHGAGQFTVVGESTENACATGVNIVAQTGPTTGLTDEDLSNWDCSVHEAFQTFPADYTPLALAPTSSGFPDSYCADDVETQQLACGSPYIMVSGGGVTVKSGVTLAPATQTLTEGGKASLTATVTSGSAPVSGATVTFDINSGPNVGATFTGTTSSAGQVTFTYADKATGIGTDQVSATYTNNGVSEKATASVTWQSSAVQPTTLATSLSGAGVGGPAIKVPAGTAVTDSGTLSGTNAATATGSVTYNVYSDSACTKLVQAGSAESITTAGSLPASAAVTLPTAGTYYWTASYSGDDTNQQSASSCGAETVTVTAAPTSVSTQLSAGDTTGTEITVTAGTAVTDSAMVSGAVASSATGSVTYNVYSDSACTKLAQGGSAEPITTPGVLPSSAPVPLTSGGTYYWTASYSGDANDQASVSQCGSETVTVTATPTTLATSLSGGGSVGTQVTVTAGTAITDTATLSGADAKAATGTVTYNVYAYSNGVCGTLVSSGSAEPITVAGSPPPSAAVTLKTAGSYSWTVSYSGDSGNEGSTSPCGAETVTVTPASTTLATSLSGGGKTGTAISVPAGSPVTDTATLSGAVASSATGSVTYFLYTACTEGATLVGGGTPQSIATAGVLPASPAVTVRTAGTYYWSVSYSGDANNLSAASCGSETLTVTAAPTTLATSLSGGGVTGTAITVQQGTSVTDSATLSGAVVSGATGTVTYNVYSDSKCSTPVSGGTSTVQVGEGGAIPSSAAVTLGSVGTYYWTASYSGDANDQPSTSSCSETVTVSPVAQPTALATSLSGGGETGPAITVTAGTAVTDSATLSGSDAAKAAGTVTYNVYSDSACTKLFNAGTAQTVTAGALPTSAAVTLSVAGTYYWQVAYSGDTNNQASVSKCGAETVTVTPATTTLATSLSGAGQAGTAITVPAGNAVTDSATLSGAVASGATGTVTFNVYSNSTCTTLVQSAGKEVVSGGKVHASAAVTLTAAGTYYWTASYSSDASDQASASACGSEKLTIIPLPATDRLTTAEGKSSTTAKITTTSAGDLLVALVAGRGPSAGGQRITVSGGGLTWHLIGRENSGRGDAEIWTATASSVLKAVSVKAAAKTGGYTVTMTVISFKHALGTEALAKATATKGAPKATLKTGHYDSWVIAMTDDSAHSVTPKPATGQYVVSRVADSTDTFWAQSTTQMVATAGTSVIITDTTPTKDPYDLIAFEVY